MRTQATAYYDRSKDRPVFGIKVMVRGRWYNLAEDGKPVLFVTERALERKRERLRRQPELRFGIDGHVAKAQQDGIVDLRSPR